MKLTILLLTVGFLNVSATSLSQSISFSGKNVPLKKIFSEITKQTGYGITFTSDIFSTTKPVSINVKNIPLTEFLDKVLDNQGIKYRIEAKSIFLSRKLAIDEFSDRPSQSNQRFDFLLDIIKNLIDIKGRVVNEKGEPLEGVTVTVKGTNKGTSTDKNGEFSLKGIDENAVIEISYVGFERQEIKLNGRTELTLGLKTKVKEEEKVTVVSTGYQDIPKERATGSFVKIDNELLNRKVSTNILERIYEVTSGLNINPTIPENSISIRGVSSINANKNPLIVIDGFPVDDGSAFYIPGNVQNINPNDVESITILKDAAAASIWGAKAGNGVIVITTKKGRFNQRSSIQINSNLTIGERPDLNTIQTLSPSAGVDFESNLFNRDYYKWVEDIGNSSNDFSFPLPYVYELLIAKRDGSIPANEVDAKIENLKSQNSKNDINKFLLQRSINQQYAVNVSGGTSNYNYYFSIGADKNRSNRIGNNESRYTIRFDNTFRPIRQLEINGYVVYTEKKVINNGIEGIALLLNNSPYIRLVDDDGKSLAVAENLRLPFVDTAKYPGYLDWHYRPIDEINNNDNTFKLYNTRLGVGIKYQFITGLNAEVRGQYEKSLTNARNHYNINSFVARDLINRYLFRNPSGQLQYPIPLGGILDQINDELTAWNIRGQLNFNKHWRHHEIVALAGAEMRELNTNQSRSRRYGYNEEYGTFNNKIDFISSFALNPDRGGTSQIPYIEDYNGLINRFISYYANAAYTFHNRYTITISGRKDGANLFGVKTNDKITPLWSSGLGWELSKENFYKVNWLPFLKLRFSYGFNGNTKNEISAYPTILYGNLNVIGLQTAEIRTPPNPQIRWEKVKYINLGFDFELKNSVLGGSIEYYRKKGIDLIGPIAVDPTSGIFSYTGNNASIKGNGIDVILNTRNINKQITWVTNLLLSYNSDKVTSYQYETPLTAGHLFNSGMPYLDRPLYSIFSYKWAGLNPINGDPRGYVADTVANYNVVTAGNNTTPSDLIYNGGATPKIFGSIRNTISWRKLAISFNIVYKLDYYFRRTSINYISLYNSFNGHSDYEFRWQKPGDESFTTVPSLPSSPVSDRNLFYQYSQVLVEKADHARLQDIRLDYELTKESLKNIPFKGIRFYIYLNNLGIIWRANKLDIDPENQMGPRTPRSFAIGCNINM